MIDSILASMNATAWVAFFGMVTTVSVVYLNYRTNKGLEEKRLDLELQNREIQRLQDLRTFSSQGIEKLLEYSIDDPKRTYSALLTAREQTRRQIRDLREKSAAVLTSSEQDRLIILEWDLHNFDLAKSYFEV